MSRYSPTSPPQRWDRDRFDSVSRAPPPGVVERDIRYEEKDYYSPRARYEEPAPEPRRTSRPVRYEEEDRYVVEERERFREAPAPFRPRPSAARYYEEERDPYAGAMVPRAREPERERDVEIDIRRTEIDRYQPPPPRASGRPTFIRRQSSLETFDRRPRPRYGDVAKEETIFVPTTPRRRSPPRYVERDYEEIRIAEPEYYGDEEFRGYREREISRYRKNRQSGGEEDFVEENEEIVEKEFPRRGKTRMPMRLVNKRAVIELGYPFEEEGETLIILKALGKEQIDEVIRISKDFNSRPPPVEEKTTYVYETKREVSPPPREEYTEEIIKRRTEITRDIPESVRDWDDGMSASTAKGKGRSPSPSSASTTTAASSKRSKSKKGRSRAHSVSSASTRREIILEEDRDESRTIRGGVGALVIQERHPRSERSIRAEIKALEAEKKALRLEREAQRLRGESGEVIITRERDDENVVEIKKDKKAPDPRIIRAMLATLT